MWHENEITTKSGRVFFSHDRYFSCKSRNCSSVRRKVRPIRQRGRNLGAAPSSTSFASGGATEFHRMQLKETECPRSSSTAAVRLQSSSLPPQGIPCIVEKKAIRILNSSMLCQSMVTTPFGRADQRVLGVAA